MAATCDKGAGQKLASAIGLVPMLMHQKLERVPAGTRSSGERTGYTSALRT